MESDDDVTGIGIGTCNGAQHGSDPVLVKHEIAVLAGVRAEEAQRRGHREPLPRTPVRGIDSHLEAQSVHGQQRTRNPGRSPRRPVPAEFGTKMRGKERLVLPLRANGSIEDRREGPLQVGGESTRAGMHEQHATCTARGIRVTGHPCLLVLDAFPCVGLAGNDRYPRVTR